MTRSFRAAIAAFATLALPASAAAQAHPAAQVYEFANVAPCSFDLLTATELVQSRAVYPAGFLQAHSRGEVVVSFVVDAHGNPREAKVLAPLGYKTPDPAAAAAVLTAVKGLPRLQPALREGKPVAVRLSLVVRYPNPPPSNMYTAGPNRVYNFAEQTPKLPTGGGHAGVVAAIEANVVYPEAARQASVTGRVFVGFVVGADGVVRDVNIQKGLGSGCDEAVVAAVRRLPVFSPARQNGCPVAFAYTLPVRCMP